MMMNKQEQDNIAFKNLKEYFEKNEEVVMAFDLSKIILASQKKMIPNTYNKSIMQAIWFLKLPQDFVERLQRWLKLRNILAHEYLDIKWKRISDFIQNSQYYFQAIKEAAQGYLLESR